jgi:hypothetical protein
MMTKLIPLKNTEQDHSLICSCCGENITTEYILVGQEAMSENNFKTVLSCDRYDCYSELI